MVICSICCNKATHRIYDTFQPVCNTHLVEAVNEEQGDITVSVIEAEFKPLTQHNDARIALIKAKLEFIKDRKETLNQLTSMMIAKYEYTAMNVIDELQKKYTAEQEELFTQWKKCSEENYQAFQESMKNWGINV